jgi:hypothetical protein
VSKNSAVSFSISPGQIQLFDEKFTFPRPMSDAVDAHILEYHNQGATCDITCSFPHVGPNRVSCVLSFFRDHHQLPHALEKDDPRVTRDILAFIDIRTIQSPQQSLNLRLKVAIDGSLRSGNH